MKDLGQSHFRCWILKLEKPLIREAIQGYQEAAQELEKCMIKLDKKNLLSLTYKFWHLHLRPLEMSIARIQTYMMQTGEYSVESDIFMAYFGVINEERMTATFKLMCQPQHARIKDVRHVFYNEKPMCKIIWNDAPPA